jgi:inorganic pyrophosphatase
MDSYALARTYLGQQVTVHVDRPLGTQHPDHGFLYPVNYGHLPGVLAPDGDDLDAYVLGVSEPLHQFRGCCIAVIHRLDDDDDKLVIVPSGVTLSDAEILAQTHFQERFFDSLVRRV